MNLDLSSTLNEFAGRLRLTAIHVATAEADGPAQLLNAGLARAAGAEIAYLPASDIYYPFHLEVLAEALTGDGVAAVYSAWSVVSGERDAERRSSVSFPEAEPNIELGDWAPLLCWMHKAGAASGLSFESESAGFAPWRFLLGLCHRVRPRYLCRITCERLPDKPTARDAADVELIMQRFRTDNAWTKSQRHQFLEAVRHGNWEDRLVISRDGLARRARSLLSRQEEHLRC